MSRQNQMDPFIAKLFMDANTFIVEYANKLNKHGIALNSKTFFRKIRKDIQTQLDKIFGLDSKHFIRIYAKVDDTGRGTIEIDFKDQGAVTRLKSALENKLREAKN